jgi:hypothetical protein
VNHLRANTKKKNHPIEEPNHSNSIQFKPTKIEPIEKRNRLSLNRENP